jgi:L-ascorbate metabolism protein UlaG (beta-lactamase superfamily)
MATTPPSDRGPRRGRCQRRLLLAGAIVAATLGTAMAVLAIAQESQARQCRNVRYGAVPRDSVAFWGHACFYVDMGGTRIVTDPVFESYAPGARRLAPRPERELLGGVRAVLISHAHLDHLSPRTLAEFPREAVLVCPPPCVKHLRGLPNEIRVLRPWEETAIDAVTVTAVPAWHPGGRYRLKPGKGGDAVGYVLQSQSRPTVYYSGDTEYFDGLKAIGEKLNPEIALLNVSVHLPYPQAVWTVRDIGAGIVIPGHYGAFYTPRALEGARWRKGLASEIGPSYLPLKVGVSVPLRPAEPLPH